MTLLNRFQKSAIVLFLITITLCLVFIYSNKTSSQGSLNDYTITNLDVSTDILTFENLEEMSKGADVVVMGKFGQLKEKINMLRNPNNPTEESNLGYEEGLVYNFEIDEVIAGEIGKGNIEIGMSSSSDYYFTDKEGKDQKLVIKYPLYKEPVKNATYILFLDKNEAIGKYFTPFEPFKLIVNEDKTVRVDSNLLSETKQEYSVILEDTKELVNINTEVENYWQDKISGEDFLFVKETIKKNFE